MFRITRQLSLFESREPSVDGVFTGMVRRGCRARGSSFLPEPNYLVFILSFFFCLSFSSVGNPIPSSSAVE